LSYSIRRQATLGLSLSTLHAVASTLLSSENPSSHDAIAIRDRDAAARRHARSPIAFCAQRSIAALVVDMVSARH
jgi:hypothetical protein